MKKIVLSLLLLSIVYTIESCGNNAPRVVTEEASDSPVITSESRIVKSESVTQGAKHLTFKGVPIDGTLDEYIARMKAAGFSHLGTQDGTAILRGDFAGYKGCTIGVTTLQSVDKVHMIGVMFPEQEKWAELENSYEQLKSMLTKKYGEPAECIEEFQGYGKPDTDFDKWYKLRMDECTWYTTYNMPEGDIQLSLQKSELSTCFVMLRYWDRINTDAVRTQAMDDL